MTGCAIRCFTKPRTERREKRLVGSAPEVFERTGRCSRAETHEAGGPVAALALFDQRSVFIEETGFRYVVVREASATELTYDHPFVPIMFLPIRPARDHGTARCRRQPHAIRRMRCDR